jgi:hypothetical protein
VRERGALSLVDSTFEQHSATTSEWNAVNTNTTGSVSGSATSATAQQAAAVAAVGTATRRAKEKSSMNVHAARKRILAGTIQASTPLHRSYKYMYDVLCDIAVSCIGALAQITSD